MTELDFIRNGVIKIFATDKEEITPSEYAHFSYPKYISLMDFEVHQFRVQGFGSLMSMQTRTHFGMQLLTCSFMPYEGTGVPYLLIDIMTTGKKRMIFVEYYDCTASKENQPMLEEACRKYSFLPDHKEKSAWYVPCRAGYSLIKDIPAGSERYLLARMTADCVRAYRKAVSAASVDDTNIKGLLAFRDRMINEGNPSSAVLGKVFGREGAKRFFCSCVMPDSGSIGDKRSKE